MSSFNSEKTVKKQYENSKNLDIRISLHTKYSENKQNYGDWIFEQYLIKDGDKILELGCGNGSMWVKNSDYLPDNTQLILSDFSDGMLKDAENNISSHKISFKTIDIQNIPYADNTFDIVIANMMLYHVPDLKKALAEVKRVLKNGGTFYCATYGVNGIMEYIEREFSELFSDKNPKNNVFTLQNGEKILSEFFDNIELRERRDALNVTDTNDLIDYILSMSSVRKIKEFDRKEMYERLEKKKCDGKIHIPKEYGMFVSIKK